MDQLAQDEAYQAILNPNHPDHEEIINTTKQSILEKLENKGPDINNEKYQKIVNYTDQEFINFLDTSMRSLIDGSLANHPPFQDRIAKGQAAIAAKRNQK